MADKYKIKCITCGKIESFLDIKSISHAHWTIFAWNVGENEPICICDKCEYIPSCQPIKN
jgi:hypothetical protein